MRLPASTSRETISIRTGTPAGIALIAGRFAVCVSAPFCSARTERGYATSRTWQALVQPDQQPVRDRSAARRR